MKRAFDGNGMPAGDDGRDPGDETQTTAQRVFYPGQGALRLHEYVRNDQETRVARIGQLVDNARLAHAQTMAELNEARKEVALLTKALDRERAKVRVLVIGKEIHDLLEERDDLADEYGLPMPWLHN